MSIDHKAWLFDHSRFQLEVASALHRALSLNSPEPLREAHLIQGDFVDVQAAGEAAVTPLLSLSDDFGLSYGFDALRAGLLAIPSVAGHAIEMVCGLPFGPEERQFDPGLMGTGFISAQRARTFAQLLSQVEPANLALPGSDVYSNCIYPPENVEDLFRALATLRNGFVEAMNSGIGLMVADFRN